MFTILEHQEESCAEKSALGSSSECSVRQLAAEFDASLSVVREAMNRLDAMQSSGKLEQR